MWPVVKRSGAITVNVTKIRESMTFPNPHGRSSKTAGALSNSTDRDVRHSNEPPLDKITCAEFIEGERNGKGRLLSGPSSCHSGQHISS
jgi:hypothetical protein